MKDSSTQEAHFPHQLVAHEALSHRAPCGEGLWQILTDVSENTIKINLQKSDTTDSSFHSLEILK